MDNLDTDKFITKVANIARFSKADVKIILNAIIQVFEESVKNGIEIKLRSFGHLYYSQIPARKGLKGIDLPPTTKIIFKLAENIRFNNSEPEEEEDEF